MDCVYCLATLKGFTDARRVTIQGHKYPACSDIDACNARAAENERARCNREKAEVIPIRA